jgi:hypothetical protein
MVGDGHGKALTIPSEEQLAALRGNVALARDAMPKDSPDLDLVLSYTLVETLLNIASTNAALASQIPNSLALSVITDQLLTFLDDQTADLAEILSERGYFG